ncbi:hypothetical protein pqer_cds_585 [Pandoravirus quercus]|uniref:Ankyrin repeat domain containing protein n=1 Tax=Pandoravirus quercus TaxID=2107709 RepID=A0A2U7U980_9VIRU|nr:hypothetical protein pqer_cds_585 [Pandoravirus quercus]AVK75007.1 hypothetical protein pqer_cds_585 [Pandoravirus quercus]
MSASKTAHATRRKRHLNHPTQTTVAAIGVASSNPRGYARKRGARSRSPACCLTYRRRRRWTLVHLLPAEVWAKIARRTDDGALGACLLASRDLASAFAHEAARRRAWLAQPLRQLAACGDTKALAWARRRACAQGRQHFRFGHECFCAAAGAGRLATLKWLYADQRRHGLFVCCSTTSILCEAVRGDHVDVVAWMLASMGPLCSVAHAATAAIESGASRVFALLCGHAADADFIDRKACKYATGVGVLAALDQRGLLDPAQASSLLGAVRLHSRKLAAPDVASVEWLCQSAFGGRCDWSLPSVRGALDAIIQFSFVDDANWRRIVDAVTPRVHEEDLWTTILYTAATRDAVDVVERAWPLAVPNVTSVGHAAAGSGSANVLDWLVAQRHASLADDGLSWARAAADGRRWGLAHRFYVEAAAVVTGARSLYDTAVTLYQSAITSGDVAALERLRVVCSDVIGEDEERAALTEAFEDEVCSPSFFWQYDMIGFMCTHVPDVAAALCSEVGAEASDMPADIFASLLAAAPRVSYERDLIDVLIAGKCDDIVAMLLAARKGAADKIRCPPEASARVRVLVPRVWPPAKRACYMLRSGDYSAHAIVADAVAAGADACVALLRLAVQRGRYDVVVDDSTLIDACPAQAVCDAGVDALQCARIDLARRLFEQAAARGCVPTAKQLSSVFGRARDSAFITHTDGRYTVDQPSAYETAAYAATLRSAPTKRDRVNGMTALIHGGDVACGVMILDGTLPDILEDEWPDAIAKAVAAGHFDPIAHILRAGGPLARTVVSIGREAAKSGDARARLEALWTESRKDANATDAMS